MFLRFFFENGAIIFNKLYESEYEPYEIEAKNIYYHNESDTNKLNKDVPVELYKVGIDRLAEKRMERYLGYFNGGSIIMSQIGCPQEVKSKFDHFVFEV